MPDLKVLNRFHQWPIIGGCVLIGNGTLRQVAKQAKSFTQVCCTNITIAIFKVRCGSGSGALWS